jgi:hypothetical protein
MAFTTPLFTTGGKEGEVDKWWWGGERNLNEEGKRKKKMDCHVNYFSIYYNILYIYY